MPNQLSAILVLVVSYRNDSQLLRFLGQPALKPAARPSGLQVIAVANGLTVHEQSTLQSAVTALADPQTELLASDANPGYFGGAARGLARYLRKHSPPDCVIVTNDDIYFADDFFERLTAFDSSQTGVIAPDIRVPATGNHQNPFLPLRPTRFQLELRNFLYSWLPLFRLLMLYRQLKHALLGMPVRKGAGVPHAIYAPHGACILLAAEYFRRGGTLNHPAFLYGEENFVAETCARLSLPVRYEPALRVEHHEHSAVGRLSSATQLSYMRNATRILLASYYR